MAEDEVTQTRRTRVHEQLREAILEGRLEPGARLRAESLAEGLRSSRTPVREALLLLEREGLVEVEPRRGATVRSFDAADLASLYEVRALIEPHAAALAARHMSPDVLRRLSDTHTASLAHDAADDESVAALVVLNEEFHRLIVTAASSPRLTSAMTAVSGIPRVFRSAFWRDRTQREQSLFCHHELMGAIGAGRSDLAETVMRMHIQGAAAFLADVMADER